MPIKFHKMFHPTISALQIVCVSLVLFVVRHLCFWYPWLIGGLQFLFINASHAGSVYKSFTAYFFHRKQNFSWHAACFWMLVLADICPYFPLSWDNGGCPNLLSAYRPRLIAISARAWVCEVVLWRSLAEKSYPICGVGKCFLNCLEQRFPGGVAKAANTKQWQPDQLISLCSTLYKPAAAVRAEK